MCIKTVINYFCSFIFHTWWICFAIWLFCFVLPFFWISKIFGGCFYLFIQPLFCVIFFLVASVASIHQNNRVVGQLFRMKSNTFIVVMYKSFHMFDVVRFYGTFSFHFSNDDILSTYIVLFIPFQIACYGDKATFLE